MLNTLGYTIRFLFPSFSFNPSPFYNRRLSGRGLFWRVSCTRGVSVSMSLRTAIRPWNVVPDKPLTPSLPNRSPYEDRQEKNDSLQRILHSFQLSKFGWIYFIDVCGYHRACQASSVSKRCHVKLWNTSWETGTEIVSDRFYYRSLFLETIHLLIPTPAGQS